MTNGPPLTGDAFLQVMAALGNPHRMRIIASLSHGRNYVSQLARDIGMSRPLLHMHLKRLESSGLITGSLEVSRGGKAMRYFEVVPFVYELTPELVAEAVRTLTDEGDEGRAPAGDGGGRELTDGGGKQAHRGLFDASGFTNGAAVEAKEEENR
ncbi:ArsR/SmtB family transcription factor [Streptomyces clavuligerus]|uniref:ArsR/SmtB family transcription factor n=1 Tax=Streptomyces clavuligerus TaxID=1901 RepID=UPI000301C6F7